MKKDACTHYVRDLFFQFRELAAEAKRLSISGAADTDYQSGRAAAYVEVLLWMQSQADAFMIPRRSVEMDDFDPLKDPLDPRETGRGH